MTALLSNKWHLRKVAESNSKACWICYKPSSNVLITPDNKDFFYICQGHLKDRGFCKPDAAEEAAAKDKKDKAELEQEKARIVAEYEEKKRLREKRRAERKKDKKKEDDAKKDDDEEKKDEEEKEKKVKELEGKGEKEMGGEDGVRIFELTKTFYMQRVQRIRDAEAAKRHRERLKNPNTFPSVPSGPPGGP